MFQTGNRLRGYSNVTVPPPNPVRHSSPPRNASSGKPSLVNNNRHENCLISPIHKFEPKTTPMSEVWLNKRMRPAWKPADDSAVNPYRHLSCLISSNNQTIQPKKRESLRKPQKSPPRAVRQNYHVMHPQLSSSNRKYLWKIAAVYSSRNMKILKELQNMELLRNQIRLGFHSKDQYESYMNHISKQRPILNDGRSSSRPHTAPCKGSYSSPRRSARMKKSSSKPGEESSVGSARKNGSNNSKKPADRKRDKSDKERLCRKNADIKETEENRKETEKQNAQRKIRENSDEEEEDDNEREDLVAEPIEDDYDNEDFEIISDDGSATFTSFDDERSVNS